MKNKILHIVLLSALLYSLQSCKDENRFRIPDATVYLDLDLLASYPTFRNSINDTLVFAQPRFGYPLDRIGFGGILVYTDYQGNYRAWDLCCPYEAKQNIRVFPQEDGTAICKECGSTFQLLTGTGLPITGPSKWILKSYVTTLRNDHLYITRY